MGRTPNPLRAFVKDVKSKRELLERRNSKPSSSYIDVEADSAPERRYRSILRAIIVDEDPTLRERLRGLVDDREDIAVVGEFSNDTEAKEKMSQLRPHMILLDARRSQVEAFSSGRLASNGNRPVVVFVASDADGEDRLDVEAMDYLIRSVNKPESEVNQNDNMPTAFRPNSEGRVEKDGSRREWTDRLAIKDGSKIIFIRTQNIAWIEAAGNYARLHTADGTHLMRITMTELQGRLDPNQFLRIHRSTIVNLDFVREIQPMFHGEYVVILIDGARLTVSRSYRHVVERLWG
jgi:two-component system LytT family response regulator